MECDCPTAGSHNVCKLRRYYTVTAFVSVGSLLGLTLFLDRVYSECEADRTEETKAKGKHFPYKKIAHSQMSYERAEHSPEHIGSFKNMIIVIVSRCNEYILIMRFDR